MRHVFPAAVFGVFSLLVLVQPAGAQPAAGIDRLGWLQGCWEQSGPDDSIEEQWLAPRGGSMVGVSRTVRADSLAGFELIVMREEGDRVVYEAHPSGQPAAAFRSVSLQDRAVIFENPEHDFPQRIGYRLTSPDSLLAWIEGSVGGRERRIEFSYRRAVCAGH